MLRIALAQADPVVGDLEGNARLMSGYIDRAIEAEADLVVFPELCLSGYPPEDLLLHPEFTRECEFLLEGISKRADGICAVVGLPFTDGAVRNAAAVLSGGGVVTIYYKQALPNYGVFDEKRYFEPGESSPLFGLGDAVIGISICEDVWVEWGAPYRQAEEGANLLVNISASPFHAGKHSERMKMLAHVASETGCTVAYCNLVGGQDELVFDGRSTVIDPRGREIARAKAFEEDLLVVDVSLSQRRKGLPEGPVGAVGAERAGGGDRAVAARVEADPSGEEEVYMALVLGLGDYAVKNGFEDAVLGLSGGIDSSLTAVIACDALGCENVTAVSMPSMYSSPESVEDARELSSRLGFRLMTLPVDYIFESYLSTLGGVFAESRTGVAEQNIQARIRGNLLMALSNKFGWLVLSTGNKSEAGVGYTTLYGDMAGGFGVLKDVPKTLVYRLARFRNSASGGPWIPQRVLEKEPSAELAPGQKDADSLPPYEVLDPILAAYVEGDAAIGEIVSMGYDLATVYSVAERVRRNEYKRRQAPPGIKITPRAFGRDRRMPITNHFQPRGGSG
jgi:NAD+ synthase (glutamine-hydrolysing)